MLEMLTALAVVSVLLALGLPALSSARASSHRAVCAGHQRLLGDAWSAYLEDNNGRFPGLYLQPGWLYGGVRFSRRDGLPLLDYSRPLSPYVPASLPAGAEAVFACPADRGITGVYGEIGTGRRTAYRAFGTSFRANGRSRDTITTAPSRLVVMGDPVWYEAYEATGRLADWHRLDNGGNLLFLDGSVRFVTVRPRPEVGPAVFDPLAPEFAFPPRGE